MEGRKVIREEDDSLHLQNTRIISTCHSPTRSFEGWERNQRDRERERERNYIGYKEGE